MITQRAVAPVLAAALVLTCAACQREERSLRTPPPAQERTIPARTSDLQPGPQALPEAPPDPSYLDNAYTISQGRELFRRYNCSGCHANGGGGMGPPLMDKFWAYGSSPTDIHASIAQGRPNGMPSWAGHIPDEQIWQLTAYVRSLAGLEQPVATSPRGDSMQSQRGVHPK